MSWLNLCKQPAPVLALTNLHACSQCHPIFLFSISQATKIVKILRQRESKQRDERHHQLERKPEKTLCYYKTPKISHSHIVIEENLPEGSIFVQALNSLGPMTNALLTAVLFDELIKQEARHSTAILLATFPPAIVKKTQLDKTLWWHT